MAVSHNDRYLLGTDPTFRNRVQSSLLIQSGGVISEAATVSFHTDRLRRAVLVINNIATFLTAYVTAAAVDTNVMADATQGGTVALTSGNLATQAALVTDAHIDSAIVAQLNYFITPS